MANGLPINIVVYGWFNNGNLGDELFKEAFQKLFPKYQFIFTDRLTEFLLQSADAVFIGGGSFLFATPNMENKYLDLLKSKKIFYLGVGAETDIHPIHIELLKIAQIIAIRSSEKFQFLQSLNDNVMVIPDLVYSLQSRVSSNSAKDKSVLIIPNMTVVPNYTDPHWKHTSWQYFKSEFAQFLDLLIEDNYNLKFLSMCQNNVMDDQYAAIEIINSMKHRKCNYLIKTLFQTIEHNASIISQHKLVITQRFHGIILSEMTNTPYLALYHHDKLKSAYINNGAFLSYYNISKSQLQQNFFNMMNNFSLSLPIEPNIFEELANRVTKCIGG